MPREREGLELRKHVFFAAWKHRVLGFWTVCRDLSRDAFRIFSERGARLFCGSIAFYALVSAVARLFS